jgi:lysozyme family protein
MSDFKAAVDVILSHEGGLSDHASDPGGLTNFGITLATFRDYRGKQATGDELRHITRADAEQVYRDLWWDRYHYERIRDQRCATKVFDCSVNTGAKRAHTLAQQATNTIGAAVAVDGYLGEQSIDALNACDPEEWLYAMCHQQMAFYQHLTERKPELAVFRRGWMKRGAWPWGVGAFPESKPLPPAPVPKAEIV